MDKNKDEEKKRKKRRQQEDEENNRRSTGMIMGDMFNTGIPGGLDGDFGTPI